MDNIRSWTEEDEAIIATNTDATECKRYAVELGYWKDDYIALFAKRAERKAPEINRGYYARVKAIELIIHQFLERCDTKCQIINLGCGFDTLYWRLKESTQAIGNFIELDFPTVTAKKCQIIKRNKQLLEKITSEDGEVIIRSGDLHADGYHLAACDLRCVASVRRALAACAWRPARPTLLLAECVLAYLRPEPAAALVAALAQLHPCAALLLYDQCNLGDRFGEVLVRNLGARGCGVCGAGAAAGGAARGPPAARAQALLSAGWPRAKAWDMTQAWRALPAAERARVTRLEMLDEAELLHQLNAHYVLAVASTSDLFADIDIEPEPEPEPEPDAAAGPD